VNAPLASGLRTRWDPAAAACRGRRPRPSDAVICLQSWPSRRGLYL